MLLCRKLTLGPDDLRVADAAAKAARRDLTRYAADLAVTLAHRQIQVDETTDQALVRQFTNRIAGEGSEN